MFYFINLHLDHEEVRCTRKRKKCWRDAVNREVLFNIQFSMEYMGVGENRDSWYLLPQRLKKRGEEMMSVTPDATESVNNFYR